MNEIAHTFDCPSCGASLQPPAGASTMNCAYCGNSIVIPQELRATQGANPVVTPVKIGFGQLFGEAIQMGQVVRLAREGDRASAVQLYRENTGVDAAQAERVIEAIASGQAPDPEIVRNEMAAVGASFGGAGMTQGVPTPLRRSRRSSGLGCSGTLVLLVLVAAVLIAVYNSTGPAHDLLIRLIAQLNLSGLIH